MYRFLGFFWLLLGLALLALPAVKPDLNESLLQGNNVPIAGFCFALSIYNMIRWRLIRARQIEAERERDELQRRREARRPIDPTFDFSDAPPQDDSKKP